MVDVGQYKTGTKIDDRTKNLLDLKYDLALDLYDQAAQAAEAKSKGLESLVYKVFDLIGTVLGNKHSILGSIALALDPTWQFNDKLMSVARETSLTLSSRFPVTIIPVNRTRKINTIFGGTCNETYKRYVTSSSGNSTFIGTGYKQSYSDGAPQTFQSTYKYWDCPTCFGFIKDTTQVSRNKDTSGNKRQKSKGKFNRFPNHQGEFELFVPTVQDDGNREFSFHSAHYDYVWWAIGNPPANVVNIYRQDETKSSHFVGPMIKVSPSSIDSLGGHFQTICLQQMAKALPEMITKCVPSRRNFNYLYQLIELKDSAQLIRSTLSVWKDLESIMTSAGFKLAYTDERFWTLANRTKYKPLLAPLNVNIEIEKTAAEAYIAFKFGWQSLYQAVVGLLTKPLDATKEVNFLIARNGKDTTLSATKLVSVKSSFTPDVAIPKSEWEFDDPWPGNDRTIVVPTEYQIKLRCMVNSGVRFPDIQTPFFKQLLFLKKIGVIPTPTDVYNIVPWTWLVDWFSGLGDYLRMQEELNDGKTIMNYGFMSATLNTTWNYSRTVAYDSFSSTGDPITAVGKTTRNFRSRSARLDCKYKIRKSIGTIANIGMYAGSGLTDSQLAILTSLFTMYLPGGKSGVPWKPKAQV